MNHREAIETLASERYLLGELSPEQRDAYEEHLFDCVECASDAILAAAFVERAKTVLPTVSTASAPAGLPVQPKSEPLKRDWFTWLRPAMLVPVFAILLAIIGYQNLVTYPALELAANEPRILPAATVLHGDTRSSVPVVNADPVRGSAIEVEMPEGANYAFYKFEFFNSAGKLVYTRTIANAVQSADTQSIFLPGNVKQDTYKLELSGISATGDIIALQQQSFELQVNKQSQK